MTGEGEQCSGYWLANGLKEYTGYSANANQEAGQQINTEALYRKFHVELRLLPKEINYILRAKLEDKKRRNEDQDRKSVV